MHLKRSPRVIYQKNPLVEVVCQIRFFPILELQNAPPVTFQQLINPQYPQASIDQAITFNPGGFNFSSGPAQNVYHFASNDQKCRVSVCSTFFAYTVMNDYEKWEDFKSQFLIAWDNFSSSFTITQGNRLGLRYRNVIDRSVLGLSGRSWNELIAPSMAGLFSASGYTDEGCMPEAVIQNSVSQTQLHLDDCNVLLQAGLLHSPTSQDKAFLIDSDCWQDGTYDLQVDAITQKMETLHANSGTLFRNSITEDLHNELGPSSIA